ncbi:methyltransferase [Streptomyces sp. NPDC008139]|uniref:methyltransferase n=1 Tax=Streptomyces sp. NPDC008139 TaxID=3364814 RepID=UPI0036EEE289
MVGIAGGNGELLGRILSAHPRLRGVLLERPHTVETARRLLGAAGHTERCAFLPGSFADVPAGGDVYIPSRVPHPASRTTGTTTAAARSCATAPA